MQVTVRLFWYHLQLLTHSFAQILLLKHASSLEECLQAWGSHHLDAIPWFLAVQNKELVLFGITLWPQGGINNSNPLCI